MFRSKYVRQKAQNILEMVGITKPPVDVERIAQVLGFKVVDYDFGNSDVSGMLVIEDDVRAIGVNRQHHANRRRFTIAHELGHFLAGHDDFEQTDFLEQRTFYVDDSFVSHNPNEQEANEFAAELLMPEKMLKRDVARGIRDPKQLAARYEVSEQALWIQLIDLKLADMLAPTSTRTPPS
jgi:Zn-dependent peptidase ImmA (M78 family)